MCGILGINNLENVVELLYTGLIAIQHRGQDSAGILTYFNEDKMFHIKKGLGLVKEVFDEKNMKRLKGNVGLGHVRYSTAGNGTEKDAQPLYGTQFYQLGIIHNGNVTNNLKLLRDSGCDVEVILKVFTKELLKQQNGKPEQEKISVENIFKSVEGVFNEVHGSYSVIGMLPEKYFFAFRDPLGIKPIIHGQIEKDGKTSDVFASESVALDAIGAKIIRDLEPGEVYIIDKEGNHYNKIINQKKEHRPCIFEYIYFAQPASVIDGKSISEFREQLGGKLAELMKDISADYIIPVPSTSYPSAMALSKKLKIPYALGLTRNNYIGRSFIQNKQEKREMTVREKLFVDRRYVDGKNIIVVDDSIVRGTTSKKVVSLLKEFGAKKIYFVSSAPPIKYPCVYGIDMSVDKELIASEKKIEEIRQFIGADKLFYLPISELKNIFKDSMCDACFSGNYPTNISKKDLERIKEERTNVNSL